MKDRPDDFKAKIGDDILLRVEQMDRGVWWWCVYNKDDRVADSGYNGNPGKSKAHALALCELAAIRHITNYRDEIKWEET